jgi:hypothetical protein
VRFVWGVTADQILNKHPSLTTTKQPHGISLRDYYVRTERQTLVAVPGTPVLLFFIRPYFEKIVDLPEQAREKLFEAVLSMDDDVLDYKGLRVVQQKIKDQLLDLASV